MRRANAARCHICTTAEVHFIFLELLNIYIDHKPQLLDYGLYYIVFNIHIRKVFMPHLCALFKHLQIFGEAPRSRIINLLHVMYSCALFLGNISSTG